MPRYKTPKLLTKHIEAILKHYAEYPIPRLLTKHVPELRGCAGMDVLRAIRQLQAQGMLPKSRYEDADSELPPSTRNEKLREPVYT
jgi:hypothetical protein